MALTRVYSFKERANALNAAQHILNDIIAQNRGIEGYRDELMGPELEIGYATISTDIQDKIDVMDSMVDRVRVLLATFNTASTAGLIYEELVRPYTRDNFTSWAIDYNFSGDAGNTKITASGGAPFTSYIAGDVITISNCSEPTYDGNYTIKTHTSSQVIVLTGLIGDTTVTDDIDPDTSMTIRLYQKFS